MKVLVTGHRGYIGAHLVDVLKEHGHDVTGCDLGLFDGCELEPLVAPDRELVRDVRTLTPEDLDGHDCVMHLAAISNDPMGDLDPTVTLAVNRDASIALAHVAKEAGVPRFLFAGSCSVYGKTDDDSFVGENGRLSPLTTYARSKIEAEAAIAALADDTFAPVFLRNATAFGASPMLRIDLVVNNLLACAHATGAIEILSDGTPWRPLIHCRDIARAFLAFAEAPAHVASGRAINVGANDENYRVRDIAGHVQALIPSAKIVFAGTGGDDPRSYRVDFSLLGETLPDFRLEFTLASGMADLYRRLVDDGFDVSDWTGTRFVRLRTLRSRLERLSAVEPAAAAVD